MRKIWANNKANQLCSVLFGIETDTCSKYYVTLCIYPSDVPVEIAHDHTNPIGIVWTFQSDAFWIFILLNSATVFKEYFLWKTGGNQAHIVDEWKLFSL